MASNWKIVRAKAVQESRLDEARVARHKAQALAVIEACQLAELRQAALDAASTLAPDKARVDD